MPSSEGPTLTVPRCAPNRFIPLSCALFYLTYSFSHEPHAVYALSELDKRNMFTYLQITMVIISINLCTNSNCSNELILKAVRPSESRNFLHAYS